MDFHAFIKRQARKRSKARYRLLNEDKIRQAAHSYYVRRKRNILKVHRLYRLSHLEEDRARSRAYYKAHKEERRKKVSRSVAVMDDGYIVSLMKVRKRDASPGVIVAKRSILTVRRILLGRI